MFKDKVEGETVDATCIGKGSRSDSIGDLCESEVDCPVELKVTPDVIACGPQKEDFIHLMFQKIRTTLQNKEEMTKTCHVRQAAG